MQYLQQHYKIVYTLKNVIVKSTSAFDFNGTKFSPSVRLNCFNIYETNNEKTQCIDTIDSTLIVKIDCDSDLKAGILVSRFREFFKAGNSLEIEGETAKLVNKDFVVSSIQNCDYFLKYLDNFLSKSKK